MNNLYEEIIRRFPEIRTYVSDGDEVYSGDESRPYTMMGYIARWLKDMGPNPVPIKAANRVKDFVDWCKQQTPGKTAADDIQTILVVSLFEDLFDANHTRALLPKLITRDEFIQNADYLKSWVGEENYKATARYF
jgi:hypothetical protein